MSLDCLTILLIKKDYTETIVDLENLKDIATRYNKRSYGWSKNDKVQKFIRQVDIKATKGKNVPNNKGLGVVYWRPKGEKLSGYSLSAWQLMNLQLGCL
jgi:arabinogalactan endo-1,4-beta-galactosidase